MSRSDTQSTICIAGLGSPHGDDQAGWLVIEELERLQPINARLITLTAPHQLLNEIEGLDTLYVCDAAASRCHVGTIQWFDGPKLPEAAVKPCSTHNPTLSSVLALIDQLTSDNLKIRVASIAGEQWRLMSQPNTAVAEAARKLAYEIVQELSGVATRG
ncbi:MAG: hydrogenase maturation protease [Planctomycetaceae bacterium]|nr:hydrogenase maturation protease [Planctomycetaceae bacterium]MCB9949932.1 hydrogenase maturation protease [Planctomycetaceae bacterium]